MKPDETTQTAEQAEEHEETRRFALERLNEAVGTYTARFRHEVLSKALAAAAEQVAKADRLNAMESDG